MWQPGAPGLFPVYFDPPVGTEVSDKSGLVQFKSPANEVEFNGDGYQPYSVVSASGGFKRRGSFLSLNRSPLEDENTAIIRLQPVNK